MWYKGQVTHYFRQHPLILILAIILASAWIDQPTVARLSYLLAGVLLGHFYW